MFISSAKSVITNGKSIATRNIIWLSHSVCVIEQEGSMNDQYQLLLHAAISSIKSINTVHKLHKYK